MLAGLIHSILSHPSVTRFAVFGATHEEEVFFLHVAATRPFPRVFFIGIRRLSHYVLVQAQRLVVVYNLARSKWVEAFWIQAHRAGCKLAGRPPLVVLLSPWLAHGLEAELEGRKRLAALGFDEVMVMRTADKEHRDETLLCLIRMGQE